MRVSVYFVLAYLFLWVTCPAFAAEAFDTDAMDSLAKKEYSPVQYRRLMDRVDPHHGNLSQSYEDIRLRGPAGFDISVVRSYDVSQLQSFSPLIGVTISGLGLDNRILGLGWTIQVAPIVHVELWGVGGQEPYLTDYDDLCKGKSPANGSIYTLVSIDGKRSPLHLSNSSASAQTINGWVFSCASGVYKLESPDGIKFKMGKVWENRPLDDKTGPTDHKMKLILQATKVVDPSGNWYDISYRTSTFKLEPKPNSIAIKYSGTFYEPARINSSDGRVVDFEYEDNHIIEGSNYFSYKTVLKGVSFPGGEINYEVSSASGDGFGDGLLTSVRLPNGASWKYEYFPSVPADPARPVPRLSNVFTMTDDYWTMSRIPDVSEYGFTSVEGKSYRMKKVTLPTGGAIEYDYAASELVSAWRNSTGVTCRAVRQELYSDFIPPTINILLTQFLRVVSRHSSDGATWRYSYTIGGSAEYDTTEVNGPDGKHIFKHVGSGYFVPSRLATQPIHAQLDAPGACEPTGQYTRDSLVGEGWKLGLLMEEEIPEAQYKVTYDWSGRKRSDLDSYTVTAARMPLVGDVATGLPKLNKINMVSVFSADLVAKAIQQNGAVYKVAYFDYDDYGNPGKIVEAGPGGGNRTTTRTYLNDTANWIIGKLKDEVVHYEGQ